MLSRIKHGYRVARLAWRFFTQEELKSRLRVPWRQRLARLRHGYLSQVDELYDLDKYQLEDYLSDWAKARTSMFYDARNVRAGYQYGVNNKLFSTAILGQHLRVPEIYAIIERGRLVPLHPRSEELFAGPWLEACRLAGGKLVFKPSAGGRGAGVFVLAAREGRLLMDGEEVSEEAVQRRVGSLNEYIVVEFLVQGEYPACLYPEATNTIRVITLIEPDTARPYLAIAVQRIGRVASRPVDNWSQSGLSAEIDLESGRLGRAAAREGTERRLAWHEKHPDTGAPIMGVEVPRWGEIKAELLRVASRLAYFKYLSWDVVPMDDGFALIEADTVSGIEMIQVHRPLLLDPRVKRFFQHYGYVRG